MKRIPLVLALLAGAVGAAAAQEPGAFTRADTLRGSYTTPGRVWWDVTFYDLQVRVDTMDRSIRGSNGITYRVLEPGRELQIDLQEPLALDSVVHEGVRLPMRREGPAHFVTFAQPRPAGVLETVTAYYHGRPRAAPMAPWDGGFTWAADSLGRAWIATTDQGLGASVWWPTKDTQAEEPDSQRIAMTVPDPLIDVSNGRLRSTTRNPDGTTTYEWFVASPINNYGVAISAGHYAHYQEEFQGEDGVLTLDFWPIDYHLADARRQFPQVRSTLECFEHWFGPYPWYEDGFKLVETPYLGMEHQSAVAYGNGYGNGYLGQDLSGTGLGLQWDYIIVHETAHEWWGNNITTKDIADMWVHEGFGTYAEGLYTECLLGTEAGARYLAGLRRQIGNDGPIVGAYNVNSEGSGDMYFKGAQMLHTIRQIVGDDERWRGILRGLNAAFRHQTVWGWQVEQYVSDQAGVDLAKVFDQYLRTRDVPVLEYRIRDGTLEYRWAGVVPGFDMPVAVTLSAGAFTVIHPTEAWAEATLRLSDPGSFAVDPDWYVVSRNVGGG